MAIMNQLRSPIPWQGGKHYSAQFILEQFPSASQYDVFVDAFGGGANILLTKPAGKHLEIYNDLDGDLVNCWMHLRDDPERMQERLQTLPYARSLYYSYHRSLYDGTALSPLERAVRWLYVLNSSFRAEVSETASGWLGGLQSASSTRSTTYHNRIATLSDIATRFKNIDVENKDFEDVIKQNERVIYKGIHLRSLIYCDPPYIDSEFYYKPSKDVDYKAFHQRLARVLNETPAMVALSYYNHPWIDELYPPTKWRRVTWQTTKHSQRTKATRDKATELLLMNYPEQQSLWD